MSHAGIVAACSRLVTEGGVGAVASVARRRGSLPMSGTAKMLVTIGGARHGTVGGGCLEAAIVEQALDVAERRQPLLVRHSLNAELAGDYGLTCGGTVDLLVEPVFPDETLAAVYRGATVALARGEPAALITGRVWDLAPAKALLAGSEAIGAAPGELLAAAARIGMQRELPRLYRTGLVEVLLPPPRLIVFGAGHVGRAVAYAATAAGWRVTIVDDRADFADPRRLAGIDAVVCCDFSDVARELPLDGRTYCVVATRGHQHDAVLAEQLLRRPLRYVGMLGSRRKAALTRRLLARAGIAPAQLDQLRAPVGLAIGADTPEEIAVSVVAEMIAVRRGAGATRSSGTAVLSSPCHPHPLDLTT